MCKPANGSGSGSELPVAPLPVSGDEKAKDVVVDAGLKSLDHCMSPEARDCFLSGGIFGEQHTSLLRRDTMYLEGLKMEQGRRSTPPVSPPCLLHCRWHSATRIR